MCLYLCSRRRRMNCFDINQSTAAVSMQNGKTLPPDPPPLPTKMTKRTGTVPASILLILLLSIDFFQPTFQQPVLF